MTKESIWYIGYECFFEVEVLTIDEAQYWIDYYQKLGFKACALHYSGRHQVYVSKVKV
jgi:hypothetical protein